ncbi:Cilia- and flagella-associated protein 44 [Perkinsus chesapeaki]|uniref:Cilia- and flagella-associated protein 44 n=1 Tax=Perkinsus chesapeaki TaxID=330153 RepID=A0A7J6LBU6_PERCH|nr:Cilia- and flagella-associated protein 44 [Perkinsus chesapeaki]
MVTKELKNYMEIGCGDAINGSITGIRLSIHESCLVVSSNDGSLSVNTLDIDKVYEASRLLDAQKREGKSGMMIDDMFPAPDGSRRYGLTAVEDDNAIGDSCVIDWGIAGDVEDIIRLDHYSIEESKLKDERDKAYSIAEGHKDKVREEVSYLRKELESIKDWLIAEINKDNLQPLTKQESIAIFTVDQDYVKSLRQEIDNTVEKVNIEMAYEVEKSILALNKVNDRYLDGIDCEIIIVETFKRGENGKEEEVGTFRTRILSDEFRYELERLKELIDRSSNSGTRRKTPDKKRHVIDDNKGDNIINDEGDEGQLAGFSVVQKRDIRRAKREDRRRRLNELESSRPDGNIDDERDIEAIKRAEEGIGSYILKSNEEYKLNENNERMNTDSKRKQMLLLQEALYTIMSQFNKQVLDLRNEKRNIRMELIKDIGKLRDIDKVLSKEKEEGDESCCITSSIDELEEIFHMREGCGDNKGLARYNAIIDMLRKDLSKEYPQENRVNGAGAEQQLLLLAEPPTEQISHIVLGNKDITMSSSVNRRHALGMIDDEKERERVKNNILKAARDNIIYRIKDIVERFDRKVIDMGNERVKLYSDIKMGEIRLITLYEELSLLVNLEDADGALYRKLDKSIEEMTTVMDCIKECQISLLNKRREIEKWGVEEDNLQNEFNIIITENPGSETFTSALTKIYRRKVKRPKKRTEEEGKDGDDDSFDSDLDSDRCDAEVNAEEVEEEAEEDVCPTGCSETVFKSVIELRNKRLDMEEALNDIQKAVEEIKKEHLRLLQKEKSLDKEQLQAEECLSIAGSSTRLRSRDTPNASPSLKPGQSLRLPPSLDNGYVVFTKASLERLMKRILELHEEKAVVIREYKELRKVYSNKSKENKKICEDLQELEIKLEEIQQLKFGQLVDIDHLEKSGKSREQEELEKKLRESELKIRSRLGHWEDKIKNEKRLYVKLTKGNTEMMEEVGRLGQSRATLENDLNGRITTVTVDGGGPQQQITSDVVFDLEYERMQDLLNMQRKEIATLQAEIELFRRKGGHIYTTVTAVDTSAIYNN